MNFRVLFDEGRRGEIQSSLSSGKPIEFRKRPPEADEGRIGPGIPIGKLFPIHERISRVLGKHYGTAGYQSGVPFGMDSTVVTARILKRMARAEAEGMEKEEAGKKEGDEPD
jgi:hypothetical protein